MKKLVTIFTLIFITFTTSLSFAGGQCQYRHHHRHHQKVCHHKHHRQYKIKKLRMQFQTCADDKRFLEEQIIALQDQISDLFDQIADLKAKQVQQSQPRVELLSLNSEPQPQSDPVPCEPRKMGIYKMSQDHPNTPGAYGMYTNFFIPECREIIDTLEPGTYRVHVTITSPSGKKMETETDVDLEEVRKDFYDVFLTMP